MSEPSICGGQCEYWSCWSARFQHEGRICDKRRKREQPGGGRRGRRLWLQGSTVSRQRRGCTGWSCRRSSPSPVPHLKPRPLRPFPAPRVREARSTHPPHRKNVRQVKTATRPKGPIRTRCYKAAVFAVPKRFRSAPMVSSRRRQAASRSGPGRVRAPRQPLRRFAPR
jgi:hypothetical protein